MKQNPREENEQGFILAGVLIAVSLGALISIGMLESAKTTAKTRTLVKNRSLNYYQVEQTLNSAVVWLQDHSKDMVNLFKKAEFESNFTLGDPVVADNEGTHFKTPTMVKVSGTNDAPMLSNNVFFGTSNFPTTENIDSGASFNPVTSFQAAGIGPANARIVMVWARTAGNEYEPVYRVDVLTGNNPDRGVHSFSYVYSKLVGGETIPGFFGRDSFETGSPNNQCNSFLWVHDGTNWTQGASRSNCSVGSNGDVDLSSQINGSASTIKPGGINLGSHGQANSYCDGPGCHSVSLPDPGNWNSLCNGSGINASNVNNETYAEGDNPATGARPANCWKDVSIKNKKYLKLTDYENPYYFRNLEIGKGELQFGTIPVDKKVTIYVEQFGNNKINGGMLIGGPPNAPHQIEIIYTGTSMLRMNGNADLFAMVIAPYAHSR